MLVSDLFSKIDFCERGALSDALNIDIRQVTCDSREVEPGTLFVAVKGSKQDGHGYIPDALEKGAAAVILEDAQYCVHIGEKAAWALVPDARKALSRASHLVYDRPSSALRLIGVTGTNGKTTITYMLESIFSACGKKAGVIGTLGSRICGQNVKSSLTTPQSHELHALLRKMALQDVEYAMLEASSEGLATERLNDCEFDVGVLTNVTRDHFNTHGTYDNYLNAKLRLFRSLGKARCKSTPAYAVLNADDRPAHNAARQHCSVPVYTFGLNAGHESKEHALAQNIHLSPQCSDFSLWLPGGTAQVHMSLVGRHNVYNAMAAALVASVEGVSSRAIEHGLAACVAVPGRWEPVDMGQPFSVFVDFAHNPDALLKALECARLFNGRIILVFGCEGNKDRGKRPLMGGIAARNSDYFIVTSDNPHTEDLTQILNDIISGVPRSCESASFDVIPDRREAIREALSTARAGDVVVIAGKGHEQHLIAGDQVLPFDDRAVVRDLLPTIPNVPADGLYSQCVIPITGG